MSTPSDNPNRNDLPKTEHLPLNQVAGKTSLEPHELGTMVLPEARVQMTKPPRRGCCANRAKIFFIPMADACLRAC